MVARGVMRELAERLKVPHVTFSTAMTLFDVGRRFLDPPDSQRGFRFLKQRDFPAALQFHRILQRAEGVAPSRLDAEWEAAYARLMAGELDGDTPDGVAAAAEERPVRRRRRHRRPRRFGRRPGDDIPETPLP